MSSLHGLKFSSLFSLSTPHLSIFFSFSFFSLFPFPFSPSTLFLPPKKPQGYNQSGDCLEKESKQVVEDPTIRKFRLAVLDGEWDTVLELLSCLHPPSLENSSRLKYVVYRQKYLELLEVFLLFFFFWFSKNQESMVC